MAAARRDASQSGSRRTTAAPEETQGWRESVRHFAPTRLKAAIVIGHRSPFYASAVMESNYPHYYSDRQDRKSNKRSIRKAPVLWILPEPSNQATIARFVGNSRWFVQVIRRNDTA